MGDTKVKNRLWELINQWESEHPGERLAYRDIESWTRKRFGDDGAVSERTISAWVRGPEEPAMYSRKAIKGLCAFFGVTPGELLVLEEAA